MKPTFLKEVKALVDQLIHGDEAVERWLKKTRAIDSMKRLPGDASTRRYYRIHSGKESYVLMKAEPFNKSDYPFIQIQKHLSDSGIDVPQIHDADAKRGMILLEDLGDSTLLHRLQKVEDVELEKHVYQRAIDALVDMQVQADPKKAKKKIPAFSTKFDFEKLMWEINYCIENFYELHLNRKIRPRDTKIMEKRFGEICQRLADESGVFCHRDYHSRNIMILPDDPSKPDLTKDRFVMIDFQDARMGPPQYDLVSLLRDSYYQLSEAQVSSLVDYYITRWEGTAKKKLDREKFSENFDFMTIQRNFKAIGSFASFLSKRGNSTYLKYIGNTFENIRRTLLRHPEFSDLREVLYYYYYF